MITFNNFSFRYEESPYYTLKNINMTVQTGELPDRLVLYFRTHAPSFL